MNLNNTVIEVLNREHGQKVKKFFQENGISTSHFLFNGNKEDNNAWRYYGLISNEFNFYSWAQVQNAGAKIMILPEEYTNFAEEGYKFLKEGEMILESDEWLEKGKWHKFNKDRPSTIGTKFEKSYCPHRRKITKTQNMKTQTISKTNLKLIHDIACSSWQTKLESKAKENPWSDSVEFTEEEVKEIKTRESKQKKTKLPPEYTSKSCRTCKHLVYNGLQQIQMQFGNCYNESSPKTICKCNDVCDVWEYRGDNQLRNELTDRTTLKIAVLTFNTGVLKMRSSLSPRIPYEEKK